MPVFQIFSLIALQSLIAVYIVWRTSIASPLSIFAIFNVMLGFYLYYTQTPGFDPTSFKAVLPYFGLQRFVLEVVTFYTILNVAALLTALSVKPIKNHAASQIFIQMRFLISPPAISIFLAVMTLLTLFHIMDFDLSYLWDYRGYHTINDFNVVGISNPISGFYHRVGPLFAAICWALAVVCFHTGRRWLGAYAILLGSYGMLLILASSSREIAQFFIVPAIVHYFFKRKIDIYIIAGSALGILGILSAISSRGPSVELGIGNLWKNIANMGFGGFDGVFDALFSNVAQGGLAMANTLNINPTYPSSYVYVSMFSPLTSNFDHYEQIRSKYQVMITHASPVGALAEVYQFGWVYCTIFVAALLVALRAATIKLNQGGAILTIPILGLTMVMIYIAHHYPARQTNRLMLMLIALHAIDYFLNRRSRSKLARRTRLAAARSPGVEREA